MHVLLIISGGIAAYKSLDLGRALRREGHDVHFLLTAAAEAFVTPLSCAALSENPVHRELLDVTQEAKIGHIQLARMADVVLVCPATADIIARMAAGRGNDLATTVLLATTAPILVAPAMNP
ncbi:MAG TPA: bifunctional phosphopantothenoylcysteine decarboxylase/phosphopantothenate synthase, partial [Alphaproteobacteria bacterium]|nr:bifunctional phosphopantothenoylcysteine decarboxylase/phosphopantothenate synthase [Alphaproteobacteria bacterium]